MSERASAEDPQTAISRRLEKPANRAPAFTVEVLEGPAGESLRLDATRPAPVLVGQSPVCDLRLADPEVSRRHFSLELSGESLRLDDLDSTNGTRVNGVVVGKAFLHGGEVITVGSTTLRVRREDDTETQLTAASSFGRVMGGSFAMRRLYPLCRRLAESDVSVIIEGETGTGKEVLAESLHEHGPRASGPFVVFDCTAVPPNLVEAALFGHERGAFTGATEARRGVFEEADKGTLLIDEIGDLDIDLQAKLLRALERSEVRRIGGSKWLKFDVRILAATRRNLDQEVQAGRCRDDLFFRLAVTRIELPPLRRRTGDIALLARHFWKRLADPGSTIPHGFVERLESYKWPGNVRELQNAVARRVALGELANDPFGLSPVSGGGDVVPISGDAPALREEPPVAGEDVLERILALNLPLPRARQKLVAEFERRYVERILALHDGNAARAAAASGIARRYFRLLRAKGRQSKEEEE
jgi:DNA-binding NtrC family response regulator